MTAEQLLPWIVGVGGLLVGAGSLVSQYLKAQQDKHVSDAGLLSQERRDHQACWEENLQREVEISKYQIEIAKKDARIDFLNDVIARLGEEAQRADAANKALREEDSRLHNQIREGKKE